MKKYTVAHSGVSSVLAYSVMNLFASWAVVTNIYGVIPQYASEDKLAVLLILFNVLSVFSGILFGVLADVTENKKIGVWLGVGLLAIGFAYPSTLGVTVKTVCTALGVGAMNAFAITDISKNHFGNLFGIGTYIGLGILGYGLGKYNMYYGYFAISLAVIPAVIPTKNAEQCNDDKKEKIFSIKGAIITLLTALSLVAFFTALQNVSTFDWIILRKHIAVSCLAFALGGIACDVISNKLGTAICCAASVGGFAVCTLLGNGKISSLLALFFLCSVIASAYKSVALNTVNKGVAVSFIPISYYCGIMICNLYDGKALFENKVYLIVSCIVLLALVFIGSLPSKKKEDAQ